MLQMESATGLPSVPPDAKEQEMREEIEYALAHLPTDQREAFILKYVEDRSYEEMSKITGAGVSALKMRVKRACERLRELLGGVYDEG
jgi:RNA polymerase sigma-70 factor (ECF subfamily)